MTIDNVINKWKRLKEEIKLDPIYKDCLYFRIKPLDMNLFNAFYMSANINQKLLIYIEFPINDDALKSYTFPKLNGVLIDTTIENRINDKKEYLRITKEDNCPEELFISLCVSLMEGIHDSTSNKSSILIIDEILKQYSNLFTKKSNPLSKEEEQGLYCELLFLEKLIETFGDTAVKNWNGPQKNKHDFIFEDNKAVEIKSTSNQEQIIIHISNENQLDNNGLDELILMVYIIESNQIGNTVGDLIKRVLNIIDSPDMHLLFVTNILSLKIDPYEYIGNYHFSVTGLHRYLVDDKFGRITKSNIPSNAYDVKYRLNISDEKEMGV